jgi:L-threonylcarbamoyladenylate synthase
MVYNTITSNNITQAADFLTQNQLVAIPTETVYGLAAKATSLEAIGNIYTVKNRPSFNPLILHIGHANSIEQYAYTNANSQALIQAFMPGPFTILLPKKNTVNDVLTAGSHKVALRIPQHPMALSLLQQLPFALVAPSANPSGYVSPTSAAHVLQGLQGKIPFILDGGQCQIGLESTIVETTDNNTIIVHRYGAITAQEIAEVLPNAIITTKNNQQINSPGQLKSHYATLTPLSMGNVQQFINQHQQYKIAVISLQNSYQNIAPQHQYILSPDGNVNQAAQRLFAAMRLIDTLGYDYIIAEEFPKQGIGLAINDRLIRAQAIMK